MSYHIETILRRDYSLEKTEICLSFKQQDFSVVVYPKKALNSNNKENYILIIDSESNQYTSAVQFAENLVEKIIKERNEEYNKYDESLEWDFYPEDLLY